MIGTGLGQILFSPSKGGGGLRSLFGPGSNGFVFSPIPSSTVFQDTAGATPVTSDGQVVGRINDQTSNGNNGVNATGVQKPLWREGAKPYLIFDGADDRLLTPFAPTAAMTLAAACRINTNANTFVLGGGLNTTNQRVALGLGGSGQIGGQWGGQNQGTIQAGSDIRGTDRVLLITGDTTTVELWLDGVQVYSAPAVAAPGNTTGIALGCTNNNGSASGFMIGNCYGALAINRRVTASEITSLIYPSLRSTFA